MATVPSKERLLDTNRQWQTLQHTLSLMVAPCATGRMPSWPALDVEDLLGESPSKQLLLRMSYLSLEFISKGDWRLGLRNQVAGGVAQAIVDVTGRVVSEMLFAPIATAAAAASVGFACAAPAALLQVLAVVSASHICRLSSRALDQLRLDIAFLQLSVSKGLLANVLATANILLDVHQELTNLLQYTSTCTPEQLDFWIDTLWRRFSESTLPLQQARFILVQRLETLTQEVTRLAYQGSSDVDAAVASGCFDKTLDLAQYLYVVSQAFEAYGAVAAFFTQLRKPALLRDLEHCMARDAEVLRATGAQLQAVADTMKGVLHAKSEQGNWFMRNVWHRKRYEELTRLLGMAPALGQNCKLATGDATELRFLITQLPNGKIGVRLLEDEDPILRDHSPALGPLWSELPVPESPPSPPTFLLPPSEDLHPTEGPSPGQVLRIRPGDPATAAADSLAIPRLDRWEAFDVEQIKQIFTQRKRPQRVKTSLSCVLALATGGYTRNDAVYNAVGQRMGKLQFLPSELDLADIIFPFENVRHAVEVETPTKLWQACATLTGHSHMHGLYERLREVELLTASVISDVEAEVLGRLRASEQELCSLLQLVQEAELDPLTLHHVLQQCTKIEREICRDLHYTKAMCDVCIWACCEEACGTRLNPEKLQALLGQFQFLWHAHILIQRCSCVQALVEIHASAQRVPQRLPIVFARLLGYDKALAHCIGVLHTVSSYLQQEVEDRASIEGLSWWKRHWTADTRKKAAAVAEMWHQVCAEFRDLSIDLIMEQLPNGSLRVALH